MIQHKTLCAGCLSYLRHNYHTADHSSPLLGGQTKLNRWWRRDAKKCVRTRGRLIGTQNESKKASTVPFERPLYAQGMCKLQCPFVRTRAGTQIIMRPPRLVGARNLSTHCCSFALSLSVFAYQQVDDGPSLEGGVSSWQPIDSTVESNGGSQGSVADSNVIIGQHLHGAYWPEIVFYWNVGRDQSAIEPLLLLLIGA